MIAPIFSIASADATVQALLGSNGAELRLYPFGKTPQGVALPYATYTNVGGGPENYLNARPDTDLFSVQIDVYGSTAASVTAVTKALNNAFETEAYITRWGNEDHNAITSHFHFDFDVEFMTSR